MNAKLIRMMLIAGGVVLGFTGIVCADTSSNNAALNNETKTESTITTKEFAGRGLFRSSGLSRGTFRNGPRSRSSFAFGSLSRGAFKHKPFARPSFRAGNSNEQHN